eukprot:1146539-Pelagomonas_calceolata.AAC.11
MVPLVHTKCIQGKERKGLYSCAWLRECVQGQGLPRGWRAVVLSSPCLSRQVVSGKVPAHTRIPRPSTSLLLFTAAAAAAAAAVPVSFVQLDADEFALPTSKRNRHMEGLSVMDTDNAGMYRPKTKETRDAFETLLAVIHTQFGEQPQGSVHMALKGGDYGVHVQPARWCSFRCIASCSWIATPPHHSGHACKEDVLRGAADEVLSVLKSKDLKDPEKQAGVEELLGPLSSDKMAQLVAISKLITDWVGGLGCEGLCCVQRCAHGALQFVLELVASKLITDWMAGVGHMGVLDLAAVSKPFYHPDGWFGVCVCSSALMHVSVCAGASSCLQALCCLGGWGGACDCVMDCFDGVVLLPCSGACGLQ